MSWVIAHVRSSPALLVSTVSRGLCNTCEHKSASAGVRYCDASCAIGKSLHMQEQLRVIPGGPEERTGRIPAV
eukprot:7425659-Pyramimonas_sp.AAC.1